MINGFNLDAGLIALKEFCLQSRRELHRIPELSGEELQTARYCRDILSSIGYCITEYEGFTGFIADLIVDERFSTIAFRADMDALAMTDLTADAYSSTHNGCAHNCGHDTHMAIALTAAKYLSTARDELRHNLRFIFQMAEEDMRVSGADKMVELGCMTGVSEVYALHNDGSVECGSVLVNDGIMSSYGTTWTMDIEGKSAHGSTPHKGLDAIREGARIVEDMDYIIAKQTSPHNPAVFVCGMFNGGTVPNAVAATVQARGTIRAMDAETDQILKASFSSIIEQCKLRGYQTSITHSSYPAIINHPTAYARIVQAAATVIPTQLLDAACTPMTGSEDFSLMVEATEKRCGAMFFLGSGSDEKGINNYLHSNPYFIDEDAMLVGAQIFIKLATSE